MDEKSFARQMKDIWTNAWKGFWWYALDTWIVVTLEILLAAIVFFVLSWWFSAPYVLTITVCFLFVEIIFSEKYIQKKKRKREKQWKT